MRFKYYGKELDRIHGLNHYDYSAPHYDPARVEFTTMDPHAENYYSWLPYAYVGNNPMKYVDPDGKDIWSTNDPEEIANFLAHLQSVEAGKTKAPFNYGGWTQMSDDEYKEYDKMNSVSFNDDKLGFNINLEDYQADFSVSMRNKDSKDAYISRSNIDELLAVSLENSNGIDVSASDLVGPSLILLGQPIKALKPVGALGSKPGSSIASYSLSKVLPARFTSIFGKNIGTKVATQLGTNTLGRALGRGVPYVGWMWTAWDVGRILGENYGGDAWVRKYKEKNK